jgi:hypothetical protein
LCHDNAMGPFIFLGCSVPYHALATPCHS